MKKTVLVVGFFATVFVQKSFARYAASQAQLFRSLTYDSSIKDVLAACNTAMALAKAEQFTKRLNNID